jgi:hypothetical protein
VPTFFRSRSDIFVAVQALVNCIFKHFVIIITTYALERTFVITSNYWNNYELTSNYVITSRRNYVTTLYQYISAVYNSPVYGIHIVLDMYR